jgi:hypothetical protein
MKLRGNIVRVDWEDHYSSNQGWQTYSEVNKTPFNKVICTSVGLVIGDQKDKLVLAQNWHPYSDGDYKVADFMVVLKKTIQKIKVLQRKVMK